MTSVASRLSLTDGERTESSLKCTDFLKIPGANQLWRKLRNTLGVQQSKCEAGTKQNPETRLFSALGTDS